jgi:hypothetical protein
MSMNQELEKICNIAGYPIYPWAADQLKIRSENGSLETRNDDNLLYLANKGAWVRVVSSVNLESNLMEYFNKNLSLGIDTQRRLAENYVLYGGTSTYAFESSRTAGTREEMGDLIQPENTGMNLRSGIDPGGAYNIFGQKALSDYGYRPMPGITSVTIESTGRMGSLRQATINFKVWDKYQLDIMDALYFRPGFTVLIEYGHAKYYDNKGDLKSSEQFMLNPFEFGLTKEDINIKLSTNTRKSYGNYGGMLGIVTSFNFSLTQEGGYDCTIKAMSLGAVMGNYPINHTSTLSNIYYRQLKMYLDSERNDAEIKARDETQSLQDAAVAKAESDLQSSKDTWAKLKIDDPFKNLLFNTNNYGNLEVLSNTITSGPTGSNDTLTSVSTFGVTPVNIVPNQTILESRTSDYKLTHDISNNSTVEVNDIEIISNESNVNDHVNDYVNKYYYIHDSTNPSKQYGYIVYYSNLRGYIRAGSDIKVTLNLPHMYNILGDKRPGYLFYPTIDNSISLEGSIWADILTKNKIPPLQSTQIDLTTGDIPYTNKDSGLNFIKANLLNQTTLKLLSTNPNVYFTIKIDNSQEAINVYNNPEQTYDVVSVKINKIGKIDLVSLDLQATGTDYHIYLGSPQLSGRDDDGNYITADLSFIKSISGDQSLMTNKPYEDYKIAVKKAEKQAAETADKNAEMIANDYNTEQLKATTDSESTLELMLRSILLFGINNLEGKNIDYSIFIKDLFSEGAYSAIFSGDIPGKPDYSKYDSAFFQKYIDGSLSQRERLDTNFRYGNNFYLMSGENAYRDDSNGAFALKNQLRDESYISLTQNNAFVPQVNFEELFKIVPITYGESSDLEVNKKPKLSVFINLGLFFLMLNHTGILYNSNTQKTIEHGDVITPMAYIDFNPETNFYLSSINQISVDPYKFLVPYNGTAQDYLKMFDADLVKDGKNIKATSPQKDQNSTAIPIQPTPLFNFDNDKLSGNLPQQKKAMDGKSNGYVGKLMYVMVDVNYLLEVIKNLKNGSDTNEVYFQTTIEQILTDLNKSMGNYNAFRLSYNDSSNCFVITDDQIQSKPDSQAGSVQSEMIKNFTTFEIPIYGKKSIARAFELRTDISSRLASMIAIASNPGATSNQVKTAKNTSDFGVYNTGSFDRYIPMKTDSAATSGSTTSNVPAAELASNFNNVVKSIYSVTRENSNSTAPQGLYISKESIERARTYYIDKMAKIKNDQAGSIHAMIIPLKSSITMDGMAGLYPFQLYTIDEKILPYRYNSYNLNNKRVAFSIARMTHTISNNEWITSVEGFMTLLRDPTDDQNNIKEVTPTITNTVVQDSYVSLDVMGYPHTDLERITYYEPILKGIGAPITDTNLTFLYAWRTGESGVATHNPFNTTYKSGLVEGVDYSAYRCNRGHNNGNPVKNYKDAATGVKAIVNTLLYSGKGQTYKDLVDLLRKGNASLQSLSTHKSLRAIIEPGPPTTPIKIYGWGTGLLAYNVLKAQAAKHKNFKAPVIETTFNNCEKEYASK